MNVLLVTHRPDRPRFEDDLLDALTATGAVTRINVEDGWDLPPLTGYDAVLYFVKFRLLAERPPIDWRGFGGLRILMDHDSFHDYGGWWGSPHVGAWTQHLPRHGFTTVVVSGERSREHFDALGYDTILLYKGFAPERFHDLGGRRSGLAHYGSPYGARLAMLRRVRRAGIAVDEPRAAYLDLNEALNRYLAVLVCNKPSRPRFGVLGRAVQRVVPGALLAVGTAPEPMGKNFEATAAGCAVFMDHTPDLDALGFIDGDTAVIYHDFDELIDKLRHWLDRPSDLHEIGRRAAGMALQRHTWDLRATSLLAALDTRS